MDTCSPVLAVFVCLQRPATDQAEPQVRRAEFSCCRRRRDNEWPVQPNKQRLDKMILSTKWRQN